MKAFLITGLLALAGCGFTAQGDFVRGAIKEQGAQAFDEGLANAEFFICKAASIGSIKRRYGASVEAAEAYNRLCEEAGRALIVPGPVE